MAAAKLKYIVIAKLPSGPNKDGEIEELKKQIKKASNKIYLGRALRAKARVSGSVESLNKQSVSVQLNIPRIWTGIVSGTYRLSKRP